MLNIIVKAVVVGLVSTAAIEITYNINTIGVLIGLNILLITGSFIAFYKNDQASEEEEEKCIEAERLYKDKLLKSMQDKSLLSDIKSEIIKYSSDQKTLIEKSNNKLEEISADLKDKDKEIFDSILKEIKNREELKLILDQLKLILNESKNKEVLHSIDKKLENTCILSDINKKLETVAILNDVNHKLDSVAILSDVNDRLEGIAILNDVNDKLNGISALNNIDNKLKELVILQDILKATKDKNEIKDIKEAVNQIETIIGRKLDDTKNAINNSNDLVKDSFEELIEVTEGNTEIYTQINNEVISKLLQLGKVNEHNINLLKDSYKVLNTIMDK